jgi:hypothetical protein
MTLSTSAQGAELIFLPFAVALAQLATLTVEDHARQAVAALAAIELGERRPALLFVVNGGQDVQGLFDATEFGDGLG